MDAAPEYVTEIATLFPRQGHWTEADYEALPEVNRIVELADGELIVNAAATPNHQWAVNELAYEMEDFAREHHLGRVFTGPAAIRLWEGAIREPDAFLLRTENFNRIGGQYIEGRADWVAEVISRGTKHIDEVDKLRDYARAGIPEYWLVDPKKRTIRVYVLRGEKYELAAAYGPGEVARAETIEGFSISVDQVFAAI